MRDINWMNVNDINESPEAGGYVAKIIEVVDVPEKEYLQIYLDIDEGKFKGYYSKFYQDKGFYALSAIKSYKEKALPFFKAFKTAVEESNPSYTFRNDEKSLIGRKVGITIGRERYTKADGSIGSRMYVDQFRDIKVIRNGAFEVPKEKDSFKADVSTAISEATPEFVNTNDFVADEGLPFM